MSREYNQIEIENLARVRSQNAQGSGHYTPTPPLGASNGMREGSGEGAEQAVWEGSGEGVKAGSEGGRR